MKRIINGKVYDTAKAEAITDNEFSDGNNPMNCGHCTTLYKTAISKGAQNLLNDFEMVCDLRMLTSAITHELNDKKPDLKAIRKAIKAFVAKWN